MPTLIKILARSCLVLLLTVATSGADPGAASYDLARQVLAETNLARTNPARYAGYLREMRPLYAGKAYRLPGSATMVVASEGVAALDEAIEFLSEQDPVPALAWSQGLAQAAADLVREQGGSGDTGHDGSRSGGMRARIERHGNWSGRIAENITYGPSKARVAVIGLIVDDGVPGRGHRKNMFNEAFTLAGVACGPHPVYRKMCVTDFASQFKSRRK